MIGRRELLVLGAAAGVAVACSKSQQSPRRGAGGVDAGHPDVILGMGARATAAGGDAGGRSGPRAGCGGSDPDTGDDAACQCAGQVVDGYDWPVNGTLNDPKTSGVPVKPNQRVRIRFINDSMMFHHFTCTDTPLK
ncbi:hypothetical protein A5724_24050 [Mycobacterium sp. ACS1612]|nr:hypothetical protein A5724_24050 [Mycobacterium sp. ACS1612]